MNETDTTAVINAYLNEVKEKFYTGIASEHAYRPALQRLIEGLCPTVNAVNDAKRVEVGAPDFVLTRRQENPMQGELFKSVPLGFVEAKDIKLGILDRSDNKEQLKRYMELGNVVHTDSLTFRFYFDKELAKEIRLGYIEDDRLIIGSTSEAFEELDFHFKRMVERHGRTIRTAKQLAILMADRARQIRHTILQALSIDLDQGSSTELSQQFEAFKKTLIHDLTPVAFADIYAETIAYGLFAARFNDNTEDDFSIQEAAQKLPRNNPFLHKFFLQIAAYEREDRINWVLENFAELFNHAAVHDIMSSHGVRSGMSHDPVIHFYETFLGEYDPKRRKARGVYYTPLPVVQYIVRAVDDVLKSEFGLTGGLADESMVEFTEHLGQEIQVRAADGRIRKTTARTIRIPCVQILDPATGTGTFLNEIIKHIYEQKKHLGSGWSDYVEKSLLPRLHGFELLMAAYAMAHMRLGLTLTGLGYRPSTHAPRLSVYLTNTLEPPADEDPSMLGLFGMARALSAESQEADRIKRDQPIMVIIGNPPYSVSSTNKSKWIQNLLQDYKTNLNERKINLDDDYVKFIRYAESMIAKNGRGIVAMITNNSYLDGITHWQMRQHLANTFDKIYVVDLHGNSKKQEVAPDGSHDENVFDIMQGVSIIIAVKHPDSQHMKAELMHSDVYGKREEKYQILANRSIKFERLDLLAPGYFFVPKDFRNQQEYDSFIKLDELMPKFNSGMQSKRDKLVYKDTETAVNTLVENFKHLTVAQLTEYYQLPPDGRDWQVSEAQKDVTWNSGQMVDVTYHPFDTKKAWYTGKTGGIIAYPRMPLMAHLLKPNLALITVRNSRRGNTNCYFISNCLVDKDAISPFDNSRFFPLYRYENDGIIANFNEKKLEELLQNLKPYYYVDREEDLPGPQTELLITALDVLDYVYAVLYSPKYRETYKEFLKIGFPRVPKPKSTADFLRLVELGSQLRRLHLMDSNVIGETPYPFSGNGNNEVEKPTYKTAKDDSDQSTENRVPDGVADEDFETTSHGNIFINDTQFFANIPESAWNSYIGGYQPAQKWLKDRKGSQLGYQDIEHYQKIIKVLFETDRIMKQIDV